LWIIKPNALLFECIEPMAKGIHNFLVASENSTDLALVSQTDILRFMYDKMEDSIYTPHLQLPLQDLFAFPQDVVTAHLGSKVGGVMANMGQHFIRAVPVVSSDGSLLDYFSMTG
jgi:CBS-domain-containing membrane protein